MLVKNFTWKFPDLFSDAQIRYEFASKFSSGNILDYAYNSHMAYYGSKILLNNIHDKIYHYNATTDTSFCELRTVSDDKSLNLSLLNNFEFVENSFDNIISFDTLFVTDHFATLELFKKILKNDGLGILSIPNSENFYFNHDVFYKKNEFLTDLKNFFKDVRLFSYYSDLQPTQIPIKSKFIHESQLLLFKSLRKPVKFFMKKFDRNLNFFELHMKNKYSKIINYEGSKIQTLYHISPSDEIDDSRSLYYIALVKK